MSDNPVGRVAPLAAPWRCRFINCLLAGLSPAAAARALGLSVDWLIELRRDDPAFALEALAAQLRASGGASDRGALVGDLILVLGLDELERAHVERVLHLPEAACGA